MQRLPWAVELDRSLPSTVLCHCHWQANAACTTTVVLVHGLQGSSSSQYIVGNANRLWRAGCNVIRMNMRNCGNTAALTPTLYHSGMSGDVTAVLRWAIARGSRRVVLAGYSMGGNLVLKAAGELGTQAPPQLAGVVAVSPPMDLGESADALHRPLNRVYEWRFLRGLRGSYRRKVELFPATYNVAALRGVRSIRDFDEVVMAPKCGFTGADDYYARAGAACVMERIAVPTLVLHALDDPFIRLTAHPGQPLRASAGAGARRTLCLPRSSVGRVRRLLGRGAGARLFDGMHGSRYRGCADGRKADRMLMEWSTACGPDDPVLEVPWQSPGGKLCWVDLRTDPDALDEIPEADEHPPLLAALRALNAVRSPVFTAKCDVWHMEPEELASVRNDLLLEEEVATAGVACYIDLVWRERAVFASRHRTAQVFYRMERLAADLPHSLAKLEGVLRPAVVDLESVSEGFALTLYVKGVGVDAVEAEERWAAALRDAVSLFRARELLSV